MRSIFISFLFVLALSACSKNAAPPPGQGDQPPDQSSQANVCSQPVNASSTYLDYEKNSPVSDNDTVTGYLCSQNATGPHIALVLREYANPQSLGLACALVSCDLGIQSLSQSQNQVSSCGVSGGILDQINPIIWKSQYDITCSGEGSASGQTGGSSCASQLQTNLDSFLTEKKSQGYSCQ